MGYRGAAPTIAELLRDANFHTEVVTRNFVFDGTIEGITRGFTHNTRPLSKMGAFHPMALILALHKPRSRRLLQSTGFFHPLQHHNRRFLQEYSRALMPADDLALDYVLQRSRDLARQNKRFFLFANLYDVHWPYPPSGHSVLRPWYHLYENALFPFVLPRIGSHAYLRPGFQLSTSRQNMLKHRYADATRLVDAKLSRFLTQARDSGLLDDTLLVVASDHGEGFGEHGLYLHDASVYETHIHVPLWVHHPNVSAGVVDDVVSLRDLFELVRRVALDGKTDHTILDAGYRARHSSAIAEHFYYPHLTDMLPQYRNNLVATVHQDRKIVHRGSERYTFDLANDPEEARPQPASNP